MTYNFEKLLKGEHPTDSEGLGARRAETRYSIEVFLNLVTSIPHSEIMISEEIMYYLLKHVDKSFGSPEHIRTRDSLLRGFKQQIDEVLASDAKAS